MIRYISMYEIDVFPFLVEFWEYFITWMPKENNEEGRVLTKFKCQKIVSELFITVCKKIQYTASDLEQLNQIS